MTTIVKGHGGRIDDEMTFPSAGTTVKFYSGFDFDLTDGQCLVAMVNGDFRSPNDEVTYPVPINNYLLAAQDDEFHARWEASGIDLGIPIRWVGGDLPDGIRLRCGNGGLFTRSELATVRRVDMNDGRC